MKKEKAKPRNTLSFSNGHVRIEQLSSIKNGKQYQSHQWFLRKTINKRTYRFPLGNERKQALKRANEIQASIRSGQLQLTDLLRIYLPAKVINHPIRSISNPTPVGQVCNPSAELTIEDILTMHSSNEKALALEERTARGYRRALLRVVYCGTLQLEGRYAPIGRLTPEQRREAEQMPVTSLTRQLARAYLQSATEEIEEFDQLESAKRTANMTLRQAKSVFSQEALEVYEDALHLPLPDVSQFKSKKPLPVEVPKYCLPPTDTLKALFHFYDSLPLRSPMWIAVSLGLFSGLRRSEVIAARYTWLSDSQGDQIHVQTESDFKPKGKKSRRVPVPCQIYAQLMKHKALATDNFLLKEAELGREKVIDDLNQHLRKIFPETQKPFHELRKLYGCWIANTEGIREAQRRLGHVSVDTTEKHYADINMTGEISQSFTISLEVING